MHLLNMLRIYDYALLSMHSNKSNPIQDDMTKHNALKMLFQMCFPPLYAAYAYKHTHTHAHTNVCIKTCVFAW